MGLASVFDVKISSVCLEQKWSQVENSKYFHPSFENEMTHYSPNFGDKWQVMVEMGKECSVPSNFDMPRPLTPR